MIGIWFSCFPQPAVIGVVGVLAHKGVVDGLVAVEYLAVDFLTLRPAWDLPRK